MAVVTCEDCLKRLAGADAKTLRARYKIGAPQTMPRAVSQGHALYRVPGAHALVSLCRALHTRSAARWDWRRFPD